ncbi:MAG: glycosyltransferase family A protein [Bacteroidota bacterium]
MQEPLITVIIPTYNYAHYIVHAIESVLSQDYPADKIEIVIVDDGSKDNTQEVVEALRDERIRFYYQENAGKAKATAKAIQLAKGKYIFNSDADDYFLAGKVRKTVEVFEAHPNVVHVGSPALIVWEGEQREKVEPIPEEIMGKVLGGEELSTYFLENNMLYGGGSTYAARAEFVKQLDITATVNQYIDEFLILGILPHGDAYLLNEALSVWRVHGKNYSGKRKTKEELHRKESELNASSKGTLNQLSKIEAMPKYLLQLYEFKHQMRIISTKEKLKTKSLGDIFRFFAHFAFKNPQPLRILKKYKAFNRLIPLFFLKLLKTGK